MYVIIAALVSAGISAVVTNVIAAHHIKVLDSYVKDMIAFSKKQIEEAYVNRDKL